MASIIAKLPPPPLMVVNGRQPIFGTLEKLAMPAIGKKQERHGIIAKAMGESSESSIIKSVQNVWDKSEDRLALIGLGFAAVVAFWASINIIVVIDRTPLIPSLLELIGILYTAWFTYRYLLYKPDREELSQAIKKSVSDILGQ